MTVLIFMALFYAPSFLSGAQDPLDGWAAPDVDLRRLDCTPMDMEAARREAPGALPPPSFRGDFIERRAVICRGRLMPPGSRRAQDEAVLQRLRDTAARFAGAVKATDGAEGRTWMVQVMHPRPAVGAKISFALKNALMDVGLPVSDRAPALAVADVQVLGALPPEQGWPLACARWAATGSVRSGLGVVAAALRDDRETILHLGLCLDGAWRWLR